jgi:hypothetical protein
MKEIEVPNLCVYCNKTPINVGEAVCFTHYCRRRHNAAKEVFIRQKLKLSGMMKKAAKMTAPAKPIVIVIPDVMHGTVMIVLVKMRMMRNYRSKKVMH